MQMLRNLLHQAQAKTQQLQLELQAEIEDILHGPQRQQLQQQQQSVQTDEEQPHDTLQEEVERQLHADEAEETQHMLEETSHSPSHEAGLQPAPSPAPMLTSARQPASMRAAEQLADSAAATTAAAVPLPVSPAASVSPSKKQLRLKPQPPLQLQRGYIHRVDQPDLGERKHDERVPLLSFMHGARTSGGSTEPAFHISMLHVPSPCVHKASALVSGKCPPVLGELTPSSSSGGSRLSSSSSSSASVISITTASSKQHIAALHAASPTHVLPPSYPLRESERAHLMRLEELAHRRMHRAVNRASWEQWWRGTPPSSAALTEDPAFRRKHGVWESWLWAVKAFLLFAFCTFIISQHAAVSGNAAAQEDAGADSIADRATSLS